MLREEFIASVGTQSPNTNAKNRDATISIHEIQPLSTQRTIYKKSETPRNCLVLSAEHVFAAQAGKAVVHVYNRANGKQEASVPFTERITAVSLACEDSVLILGTTEGRVFLWETCTGRLITTSQTHLQAITELAIDPTSNFLLSASKDSTVQVWSIVDLLDFETIQSSPLRTFNTHRSEVLALKLGHSASSANFAISAAKDRTCLVWSYSNNRILRTFLLCADPTTLTLDPADRAAYIGYDSGHLQLLDLTLNPSSHLDALQNERDPSVPIQPPSSTRWNPPDASHGAILSLDVSYDGTLLLTGHESGSILSWDVARRSFRSILPTSPLPGPVTNLSFLPVTGFLHSPNPIPNIRIPEIIKPKLGLFPTPDAGTIPANYALTVQFSTKLPEDPHNPHPSAFERALTAPSFPMDLLDEGLQELATWDNGNSSAPQREQQGDGQEEISSGFMALDGTPAQAAQSVLQEENDVLKAQLEALRRVQSTSFDKIEQLSREREALLERERGGRAKVGKGKEGVANGHGGRRGASSSVSGDEERGATESDSG